MKENDNHFNFKPIGICQRLFNFIMGSLISRGFKTVTLGHHPLPQASSQEGEHNITSSENDPNYMIEIEFKQDDDFDDHHWTPIDKPSFSLEIQQRGGPGTDPLRAQIRGKSSMEVQAVREEEKHEKRKGKKIVSEKSIIAIEQENVKKEAPIIRHVKPLFSVAPNINEKSDAFIRSRKEAMRKTFNMESKTS